MFESPSQVKLWFVTVERGAWEVGSAIIHGVSGRLEAGPTQPLLLLRLITLIHTGKSPCSHFLFLNF